MAGFTLIHGSTQNAAGWDAVAAELRAKGHDLVAPDLPKDEPSWTLARYADFIQRSMPASKPRIAVAHSFSGVFLPLLDADHFVFEAALIPEPGRSVVQQLADDPSMLAPDWLAAGPRWLDASQHEALARQYLFHDCDEVPESALRTIEILHTRHLAMEQSPMTSWPQIPSTVIVCTEDRTVRPDWLRRHAQRIGADVVEMKSGHSPHACFAQEVAEVLLRIARSPSP